MFINNIGDYNYLFNSLIVLYTLSLVILFFSSIVGISLYINDINSIHLQGVHHIF